MARLALMLKGEGLTIGEMVEFARRAEEQGYESVWVPEFWRECFVPLTAIALNTSRIGVAAGVALAYPRSAALMAQTVANIDEVSKGRFTLGIGTGAPDTNDLWYDVGDQERPLTRLRDVVEIVRRVLAGRQGDEITFEGAETLKYLEEVAQPALASRSGERGAVGRRGRSGVARHVRRGRRSGGGTRHGASRGGDLPALREHPHGVRGERVPRGT